MNVEYTVNAVCDVLAERYGVDGITDDIRSNITREVEHRLGKSQCQATTRLGEIAIGRPLQRPSRFVGSMIRMLVDAVL
ncbi:hypothetical protein VTP01DRAFT_1959 [Rhizomucor pusillus]|uniref:uncharacterized protein n=1 Tax=Rhizomucor pusillus TaxID=4840 RepID=UPI00374245E7